MLSYNFTQVQLVTTGNPVSSYLTSTIGKSYHGPVSAPFFCATSVVFLATQEISKSPLFSTIIDML